MMCAPVEDSSTWKTLSLQPLDIIVTHTIKQQNPTEIESTVQKYVKDEAEPNTITQIDKYNDTKKAIEP